MSVAAGGGGLDPARHLTLAIIVGALALLSGLGLLAFPGYFDMWPAEGGAPLWWRLLSSLAAIGIGIWLIVAAVAS